jgi:hypothetical protein
MRKRSVMMAALSLLPALAQAADGSAAGRIAELAAPVLMGLTVLLLGLGFTAAMLVTHLVVPGLTRRGALLVRRTPGRSLLYGILVTLVVLLAILLAKSVFGHAAPLFGVVLLLPWLALAVVGTAAACHSLGESLLVASGSPHQDSGPWAVGAGAGLLSLINLFVGLGQIVWLIAVLAGLGAVVRQLCSRAPARSVPSAPAGG